MTTKHTHPMVFGRRVNDCQRCTELANGAAPVRWNSRATREAQAVADVHSHFISQRHISGGCGPVCTYGD